jgi:hypothetical protein
VTQKKGTLAQSGPHRQNGTHARVALRRTLLCHTGFLTRTRNTTGRLRFSIATARATFPQAYASSVYSLKILSGGKLAFCQPLALASSHAQAIQLLPFIINVRVEEI